MTKTYTIEELRSMLAAKQANEGDFAPKLEFVPADIENGIDALYIGYRWNAEVRSSDGLVSRDETVALRFALGL